MAVDQENVSKILSVLSHSLRRQILLYLSGKDECSFTDLMNALDVDTGKLSFHIRNLAAFLEQTPTGKYKLSKIGQNAIALIRDIENWSAEATVSRDTSTYPLASFRKRVLAFLVDFAICFALFMALPSGLSIITSGRPFSLDTNVILFLVLFWIYLTLLEGFVGQSLGKRAAKTKVVQIDGKNLSYDHAAIRNFGKVFLLPFDLAIGWRLKDKRFIRYFDKFSGTIVIDLQRQDLASIVKNP